MWHAMNINANARMQLIKPNENKERTERERRTNDKWNKQ